MCSVSSCYDVKFKHEKNKRRALGKVNVKEKKGSTGTHIHTHTNIKHTNTHKIKEKNHLLFLSFFNGVYFFVGSVAIMKYSHYDLFSKACQKEVARMQERIYQYVYIAIFHYIPL